MAKRIQRTDPHRPGILDPDAYKYVTYIEPLPKPWPSMTPADVAIIDQARERNRQLLEQLDAHGAKIHGGLYNCDVCGAWYQWGEMWRHEPTGELITIGHQCADGYSLYSGDPDGLKARRKRLAEFRKRGRRATEAREKLRAFVRDNRGVSALLRGDHYILRDMRAKLLRYGSLSERQMELAAKIQREERERATEKADEPTAVAIPEALLDGRHEVRGKVLGTRVEDDPFSYNGQVVKMLVQIEAEGGAFKLWGRAPSALLGDGPLKGAEVAFACRIQKSDRDDAFGFINRPTKARRIEEGA